MGQQPTGTVTFLFTDIEGSTKLWEHYPQAMQLALARHDALLRQAIEDRQGYVFKTVGDAVCAAFTTAGDALDAALAGERALTAEAWGETGPLRVRMALNTGVAEARDGDYFGPALNRVARLLSAGAGGQVLLSGVTQELLRGSLPTGCSLRDLGEHHLKDLGDPERIYQLVAPDLPADFPPLKTLDTYPNNLPLDLTRFIGREQETAEARRLLATARLLSLIGPGGTGKTRLATHVAADLLTDYPDGAWLVELAPWPTRPSCCRRSPRPSTCARPLTCPWPRCWSATCATAALCWFLTTASTWSRPARAWRTTCCEPAPG